VSHEAREAKDVVIGTICLDMAAGTWHPYKGRMELMTTHGLSRVSADRYVAEATRILRLSWGGEDAKAAVLERIASIGHGALERTEEVVDSKGQIHTVRKPDHRTALGSARALAEILGMGTQATITMKYSNLSDAELYLETQKFVAQLASKHKVEVEVNGPIEETQEVHFPELMPGKRGDW
jgi:hypothetical protein